MAVRRDPASGPPVRFARPETGRDDGLIDPRAHELDDDNEDIGVPNGSS
jgi:hypothetical protein